MTSIGGDLASLQGPCPAPFLAESLFPPTGGYIPGRMCSVVPGFTANITCCIPCNSVYWFYPDSFYGHTRIPGFIAIVSTVLCLFMLLSYAVLPPKVTKRHYLNTCLTISVLLLELGYVIPVLAKPQQCYNAITPNGDSSSLTCAWSGALIIFGGMAINSWILVRALNMHLLICWDITPGKKFCYASHVFSWGLSAVLLATCMSITGMSFRFGDYCHVNHPSSVATYWGPLLGFAGISLGIQLWTFAYCVHVYLRNAHADSDGETEDGRGSIESPRKQSARAVYRKLRMVLRIQWRGLAIAVVGVADVVFFSLSFILLDKKIQASLADYELILPWIACLIVGTLSKQACLQYAKPIRVSEGLLLAVLYLLCVVGIECAVLLGSWDMIKGWPELFKKKKFRASFIKLDDRRAPSSRTNEDGMSSVRESTFEMLKINTAQQSDAIYTSKSPHESISSPQSTTGLMKGEKSSPTDYFPSPRSNPSPGGPMNYSPAVSTGRPYHSPRMSFSSPRAPNATGRADSVTPTIPSVGATPPAATSSNADSASGARPFAPSINGLGLHPVLPEFSFYDHGEETE